LEPILNMRGTQSIFDVIKEFNKVVNVILIININIMEVELLRLNTAIKPSLISESVVDI
jgi:DUF438 domain-containing protein